MIGRPASPASPAVARVARSEGRPQVESPGQAPGSERIQHADDTIEETPVRAIWNGNVIAESDATVVVEGNHYFPADSVRWEMLVHSDHTSVCPWKGQAKYYSVDDGQRHGHNVAWSYPTPSPAARQIAGRIAFWRGVSVEA